jgi:hypothetical protein
MIKSVLGASALIAIVLGGSLATTETAQAKGCIKGAIVGGIAGHFAGRHGGLGAAAGCVVGRHEANKRDRMDNRDMQRTNTQYQ